MKITIKDYKPIAHAGKVLELWEKALGTTYPVSERVFLQRANGGYPNWEPGDGLIACEGQKLVGFILAEIGRSAIGRRENANLSVILVDPERQHTGLGTRLLTALEQRLRERGCTKITTGAGPLRFWTGVPDDLPLVKAFFLRQGYCSGTRLAPDMVIPFTGPYAMDPKYRAQMEAAGVQVISATLEDAGALMAFENREFIGWSPTMLTLMATGDINNILLAKHDDEIVGSITCFTPGSRWRGANLVWERLYGTQMGGYGAVGIAKAWQGKGLGAAMSQAAAIHVQNQGATCCYIDWVGPEEFYYKLGARTWRRFDHMSKTL